MYQIHYCEFSRQNCDRDRIYRPNGSGDWLFLLFLTPMNVVFEKKREIARAGGCLLYSPNAYQNYHSVEAFRNSYVHFSVDGDTDCPESYGIPINQVFYPASPEKLNLLLKDLQEEYLNRSDAHSREMEDLLLRRLFIMAGRFLENGKQSTGSLREQFQQARLTFLSRCEEDWDIERMCSLVNMGKSQFYSYYRNFFGVSPREDLLKARIDRAKNLLTSETMQVQQAAALCGFKNICHFTRYFREVCGCTPGEYHHFVKDTNIKK